MTTNMTTKLDIEKAVVSSEDLCDYLDGYGSLLSSVRSDPYKPVRGRETIFELYQYGSSNNNLFFAVCLQYKNWNYDRATVHTCICNGKEVPEFFGLYKNNNLAEKLYQEAKLTQ